MRRSHLRHPLAIISLLGTIACQESGRVDAAMLERAGAGPRLRVTILGNSADPRVAPVREAIAHWNGELARLGRRVQLDSAIIRTDAVPDDLLRAASGEVMFGTGPATTRLRERVSAIPGDIIVVMSTTDLISFGVSWRAGSQGIVALRRSDILPLSLPNTVRNVAAHELGHVLGLTHNLDSTTLMCGRPASCRPTAFASDTVHFFPLTAPDERWLRHRWP